MAQENKKVEPKVEEVQPQKITHDQYCDQKGYGKRTRFVAQEIFGKQTETAETWAALFIVHKIVD